MNAINVISPYRHLGMWVFAIGPRQLTDIYSLALAVKHGGRLVTCDQAIPVAAVCGARTDQLVML